jgi:hypothetical protein
VSVYVALFHCRSRFCREGWVAASRVASRPYRIPMLWATASSPPGEMETQRQVRMVYTKFTTNPTLRKETKTPTPYLYKLDAPS